MPPFELEDDFVDLTAPRVLGGRVMSVEMKQVRHVNGTGKRQMQVTPGETVGSSKCS